MPTRIVVEWTRATLRVAVAEGGPGRRRLKTVHSQSVGAGGDVGSALQVFLKAAHPGSADVMSVLPREQVLTRLVKFPTVNAEELSQMVELYAKAQLPYPREQTVLDFHLVQRRDGFSLVAIIACQRDLVDRHVAVLRDAGLTPSRLTLSSWGVFEWYRRLQRGGGAGLPAEPVLVLNVDDARTDLVVINGDRLCSSRSIGQGIADWGPSGDAAELLALEVERSRAALRKELPGTEVRSLLLTGLGTLNAWREPMAQRTGLSVTVTDSRQPLEGWAGPMATPASPVVVGALACSDGETLLDLSPPEVRARVSHRRQFRELVTAAALALGVLVLGAAMLGLQMFRERRAENRLALVLSEIEPTAKRIQEKTRSVQLVDAVLQRQRLLAEHLSSILQRLPSDAVLETLMFERGRRELVVRGNADSTQAVLSYIKELERVHGISQVQLKYSTRRSTGSGERTDFELVMRQQEAS